MMCGSLFIKRNYGEKCCDWQGEGGIGVCEESNQNSNISKLLQDMKGWEERNTRRTLIEAIHSGIIERATPVFICIFNLHIKILERK